MKPRKSKVSRKSRRGGSGKPPRWLVLGALAASAAMWGNRPLAAETREGDAAGNLPGGDTNEIGRADGSEPHRGARRPAAATTRRFDITAGSLAQAYQAATGVRVQAAPAGIADLDSPGVSGILNAEQALAQLLEGTVLVYRFTATSAVAIDVATLAETLEVTASPSPSPFSGRLTDRWSAFLGYTLLSSEILRSNTPAEVGRELTNTPENSWCATTARGPCCST
jgi:hypothetical protein